MLRHMRTTIRLHDGLLRDAKRLAAETHRTLTAVFEEALREFLSRRRGPRKAPPVELPVFRGGSLMPGVDLDNSAALWDMMEGRG